MGRKGHHLNEIHKLHSLIPIQFVPVSFFFFFFGSNQGNITCKGYGDIHCFHEKLTIAADFPPPNLSEGNLIVNDGSSLVTGGSSDGPALSVLEMVSLQRHPRFEEVFPAFTGPGGEVARGER